MLGFERGSDDGNDGGDNDNDDGNDGDDTNNIIMVIEVKSKKCFLQFPKALKCLLLWILYIKDINPNTIYMKFECLCSKILYTSLLQ